MDADWTHLAIQRFSGFFMVPHHNKHTHTHRERERNTGLV